MTLVSKYQKPYINELDDTVNKCNNTFHGTIKMNPVAVTSSTYIGFNNKNNKKDTKFNNLNSEVDKLDIDKLAQLDADRLKPVPTDLSKQGNVVKKKYYNAKIKNIKSKITSVTSSVTVTLQI